MKILIIGGTGRLSFDTTKLCVDKGNDVYLINRGTNNSFTSSNLHYIIGNINNVSDMKNKINNYHFDVVIDYLTYTLESLKNRIEIFDGKTDQYVFISSATVFKPTNGPISESSPIGNDDWIYCKNKLICEKYLALKKNELHFAYTVVRPYITYDKNRIPFQIISKKSCWNLLYRIENNLPILICGDGEQSVTLTNTKDFAVAIVGLLGNKSAYYNDYNIVGDFNYTWNDVIREVEKCTGKKANVIYVPMNMVGKLVPSFEQEILFDKGLSHYFDNTKIKTDVPEFRSTISLSEGIYETVTFLMQSEERRKLDREWNAMENVVSSKLGYKKIKPSLSDRWIYFKSENCLKKYLKKILNKVH